MEQSPSWETDWFSVSQEITRILLNTYGVESFMNS